MGYTDGLREPVKEAPKSEPRGEPEGELVAISATNPFPPEARARSLLGSMAKICRPGASGDPKLRTPEQQRTMGELIRNYARAGGTLKVLKEAADQGRYGAVGKILAYIEQHFPDSQDP